MTLLDIEQAVGAIGAGLGRLGHNDVGAKVKTCYESLLHIPTDDRMLRIGVTVLLG